ncbi:SO2930 family diheme c-type cytochrome [Endozoicomonas lisbonensis]|uniref:Repeat protein (TIGR03806 family) n=1 Tax=Endozoicomonas lisbonensis TaxID=3120522 RepID=A0ABV2SH79_9GAMM
MKAVNRVIKFIAVALFVVLVSGCVEKPPLLKTTGDDYPEKLSEWRIHDIGRKTLKLNHKVVPYDLNTPLFTDYASKLRTVWVPEGTQATFEKGDIEYPVGTIITKTFYYPVDSQKNRLEVKASEGSAELYDESKGLPLARVHLIETRVLVRQEQGWVALPYVWNDDQTEAVLEWAGDSKMLTLVYKDGSREEFPYIVPDANQCGGCHAPEAYKKDIQPLGPKVRHLNRDFDYADGTRNQLDYWAETGVLALDVKPESLPKNALWPVARKDETLEHQARSYLDANCSHCHNTKGAGNTSGLFLTLDTPYDTSLGICKRPIAAGRGSGNHHVAIKPGSGDESILLYRMNSKDPAEMMPELGRSLIHQEGVELVREWIDGMAPEC